MNCAVRSRVHFLHFCTNTCKFLCCAWTALFCSYFCLEINVWCTTLWKTIDKTASTVSATKSIPLRTCISCRSKKEKSELVRYVLVNNIVTQDHIGRKPGRGAYLCNSQTCFDRAVKSHAFSRAFRRPVTVDQTLLTEDIKNGWYSKN